MLTLNHVDMMDMRVFSGHRKRRRWMGRPSWCGAAGRVGTRTHTWHARACGSMWEHCGARMLAVLNELSDRNWDSSVLVLNVCPILQSEFADTAGKLFSEHSKEAVEELAKPAAVEPEAHRAGGQSRLDILQHDCS